VINALIVFGIVIVVFSVFAPIMIPSKLKDRVKMGLKLPSDSCPWIGNKPVQYSREHGGWIFWDETWTTPHGPFKNKKKANEAFDYYCEHYL
jgi:hypothetical protein